MRVRSSGCHDNHSSSSITVNQQTFSSDIDGLHVITITTNATIEYNVFNGSFSLCENRPCINQRKVFQNYLSKLENGTVVIVTTQNVCSLQYDEWPSLLTTSKELVIDGSSKSVHPHVAIIIGCYGYCPNNVITGMIPFSKFSTLNDDMETHLVFSFQGMHFLMNAPTYLIFSF